MDLWCGMWGDGFVVWGGKFVVWICGVGCGVVGLWCGVWWVAVGCGKSRGGGVQGRGGPDGMGEV